jgi:hypothetical protein
MDAWSDGQMRSKVWLCNLIENDFAQNKDSIEIWILGSWYGLLAQFLLLRQRLPLKRIRLFDIDSEALRVSHKMLNTWMIENKIEILHHQMDCTKIPDSMFLEKPDVIINTSSEHFENDSWLKFPSGIRFYAQSTNMDHPTHINRATSLEDFKSRMRNVSKITHAEKIEFRYPNFEFDRYMIAGIK